MFIEPSTNIRILKNVPLDTTYKHTLYFASESAQSGYFSGLTKHRLTAQSYQRVQKSVARVSIVAESLFDCNYMMFQNTSFGNKWFYAFITGVEYINNIVSEISFEIDVMQTWFFDFQLRQCFIEREHPVTDGMWENIVPENVELGEYTCVKRDQFQMNDMSVCALTSKTSSGGSPTGRTINNIYTPLNVIAGVPANDPASLNSLLEEFVGAGQEDSIVTMYQYPSFLGDSATTGAVTRGKKVSPNLTSINGYVPKNKKLFTYPYNFLTMSNNYGQTAEYRWEDWDSVESAGSFNITGVFVSTPCVIAYPTSYRGMISDFDSGVTISNFPLCPWVGDTFKAWVAQNKGAIATSVLGSAVGVGMTIAGGATANPMLVAGGVASVGGSVANIVGKSIDVQSTPPQVHGQVQCDALNAGMNRCEFTFLSMCVRAPFAKIIDEYFTMYGYATKRVKKPNINSRPHWNYVKTVGCVATGSIPADDMKTICRIHDNGITYWKNGSEVGDYSLNNTP
jgi:hypothetical protein